MVGSQFAGINTEKLFERSTEIRGKQQEAGAGIVDSDVGKMALAKNEELKGIKAKFDGTLQTLKAQKTEAQGQQNVQQGGAQVQIGQTMVATGTALLAAGAATFGTTAWVGLGMIATGTGVSLTGGQQQQQGQQQVEAAPAYQSKANELGNQSDTHISRARELKSEAETEKEDKTQDNSSGVRTQGQQKGYIGDNLADASSSEDESPIDRLRNGTDKINVIGGTSDGLVADASSEGADGTNRTLADKLKDSSNTIAAMTGHRNLDDDAAQSLETKKESVG
ncbi:MAG: hypothetical protein ACOYK1_07065 [Vampirovibrionia bacterium]